MLEQAQSNSWRGVIIWSLYGLCKLARAARRFTVPPRPSQAPLPCDVAEKCHSAAMPKSPWWWHKFTKFFLFLYCDAAPSEKYTIFSKQKAGRYLRRNCINASEEGVRPGCRDVGSQRLSHKSSGVQPRIPHSMPRMGVWSPAHCSNGIPGLHPGVQMSNSLKNLPSQALPLALGQTCTASRRKLVAWL